MTNLSWIFIALAIAWMVQLYLSYFQMRRFYGRVSELRKSYRDSLVSIGLAGTTWKRRQYAVLVIDKNNKRILTVEELSGWTVLAKLQPVKGMTGYTIDDLFDDTKEFPVPEKLLLATRSAAEQIIKAEKDAAEKTKESARELELEENAAS